MLGFFVSISPSSIFTNFLKLTSVKPLFVSIVYAALLNYME